MSDQGYELSIIGAGNMAEAIVRGILAAGLIRADKIIAADPVADRRALFSNQLQIKSVESPTTNARIVLLSVKPQQMETVLSPFRSVTDPLFISIAAGISTSTIESKLQNARVIRAMPNTPMLVGAGMTALCRGSRATAEDLQTARQLFRCAGRVVEVREEQMNVVTAVSGSGPAYVFLLAEHMIATAITLGLPPDTAKLLVQQTIVGAGKMLAETDIDPVELRRRVTSPGGTTQAAIEQLERLNFQSTVETAIIAATKRGSTLGG